MVDAGRSLPPLSLAAAAWLGTWLATSGEPRLWVAGASAGAFVGLVAAHRRSRWVAAVAVSLLCCLGAAGLRVGVQQAGELRRLAGDGAVVVLEVRLTGAGKRWERAGPRPERWVSRAQVLRLEGRGETWASRGPVELSAVGDLADAFQAVASGSTVRVVARLAVPERDAPVDALARARARPIIVAPPGGVDAAVGRVRDGLRRASSVLAPEPRGLLPALVVGDTSAMSDELTARFKTTGLAHLSAVSGANLTLLLAFLRVVAVGVGLRGRALTAALAIGVVAFVTLCLGEPSVVRAGAMGLVGLVALGRSGRGRQGVRFLAVAVWVLLWLDPWLSRSVGFALSVVASLGLLWWAGRWADLLARWMPRWCAEAVAVPLAAQLATQPIVTAISGQVSLVGVLANVAAGPLVGPATVLGFVAAGLSVVWLPSAQAFAWLAGWCVSALCAVAAGAATLPGAAVSWPTSVPGIAVVVALCAAAVWAAPWLLARRWWSVACAVGLVAALVRTPSPPGWPPARWGVVACEVGQGDAFAVNAGQGTAVLLDTGPDPALLARCLHQLRIRAVPLVILTHGHADHVSGLPALGDLGVQQVVRSAAAGTVWQVGEATVQLLAAPGEPTGGGREGEGESSAENDASLAMRVVSGGVSVLVAGDVEEAGQLRLLGAGRLLEVDVLVVPHHGSARQSPELLAATRPRVALISVGPDNEYGHPTAKTLRIVQGLGAAVARTDLDGSIAVGREQDGTLSVTTQR